MIQTNLGQEKALRDALEASHRENELLLRQIAQLDDSLRQYPDALAAMQLQITGLQEQLEQMRSTQPARPVTTIFSRTDPNPAQSSLLRKAIDWLFCSDCNQNAKSRLAPA